jgi:uncharacterized membrane protein YkoI
MPKMLTSLSLAMAIAGFGIGAVPALAATQGIVQKPTIGMPQARRIALKAWPGGEIVKEELERERGGSGLRYSFDMKHGSEWREVGVDAVTGAILENTAEGANPKD